MLSGLENPTHIALILLVVLLVFGAKRLPEMGKGLGEGMRGFRDAITGHSPSAQLTPVEPTPADGLRTPADESAAEQPQMHPAA
jgi:sec-independent protein translocase protein TatA